MWMNHKNKVPPLRGELTASPALTGLDKHRLSLRRPRNRKRSLRLKPLPTMLQSSDFGGIREYATRLIHDQCIIIPTAPVPTNYFDKFLCAVVATVVL